MRELTALQRKRINKVLDGGFRGIFSDEYWLPVRMIFEKLSALEGFDWSIDRAFYVHSDDQVPIGKRWHFTVTDGKRSSEGVIIAAGCGTFEDPLSKYDIVAYI